MGKGNFLTRFEFYRVLSVVCVCGVDSSTTIIAEPLRYLKSMRRIYFFILLTRSLTVI